MNKKPIIERGHVFGGHDGQGYRATRDFLVGHPASYLDYEPMGGAPEPKPGEQMPVWLQAQIWPAHGWKLEPFIKR